MIYVRKIYNHFQHCFFKWLVLRRIVKSNTNYHFPNAITVINRIFELTS